MSPGIEFNRRLGDIPSYPQAGSYEFGGELVKLASNESPFGPPASPAHRSSTRWCLALAR